MTGCPGSGSSQAVQVLPVGGVGGHQPPSLNQGFKVYPNNSSWDPAVFRLDGPIVSCYSGLIFSEVNYLPRVSLMPGIGFQKLDCGSWVRTLKSGDEVRKIFHSCGVLGCPVCMPGVITDKARDIGARFELYESAKIAQNVVLIPGERRNIDPRHFVFSISPFHTDELIAKVKRALPGVWENKHAALFQDYYREEEAQVIKISGLIGGVKIYHDARVKHPDTGLRQARAKHLIGMEAKVMGNMVDGDPAWKIYDHIRKQKNWQDYYYFSPHTHLIAHGMAIDADEFEKLMPGWKYHNKGYVKNVGGLARYLISHMAMIEDHHAVSWFGRLSSKCLGKEGLRTYEKEDVHPVTGLPWVIVESTIPEEIGRIYRVTVTDYRGFFRIAQRHKKKDPDVPRFPKGRKKSTCPHEVHNKGVLALAKYCDDYGKL
jgi:hypothetical protein